MCLGADIQVQLEAKFASLCFTACISQQLSCSREASQFAELSSICREAVPQRQNKVIRLQLPAMYQLLPETTMRELPASCAFWYACTKCAYEAAQSRR